VTAPDPDQLRQQMRDRLADWHGLDSHACLPPVQREAVADALLPLVLAYGHACAADALRAAGVEPRGFCVCDPGEPRRDCGIPEHRAAAHRARATT